MTTAFARITELHDAYCFGVTPCARMLYRWLLRRRPAGKLQEIELEDFQQWSRDNRFRPYSLRHIQRALQELTELDVVDLVKRYSGKIFKLVARHPEPRERDKKVENWTKMSKTEVSNPDSTVPSIQREVEITKQSVVVKENSKPESSQSVESELNFSKNSKDKPRLDLEDLNSAAHESEALKEVQAAGYKLNFNIKKIILNTTLEVVANALEAVREYISAGKSVQRSKEALLVAAIQKEWKPNQVKTSTELMDLIRRVEAAQGGRRVFTMNFLDGVHVLHDGHWVHWQEWREEMLKLPERLDCP